MSIFYNSWWLGSCKNPPKIPQKWTSHRKLGHGGLKYFFSMTSDPEPVDLGFWGTLRSQWYLSSLAERRAASIYFRKQPSHMKNTTLWTGWDPLNSQNSIPCVTVLHWTIKNASNSCLWCLQHFRGCSILVVSLRRHFPTVGCSLMLLSTGTGSTADQENIHHHTKELERLRGGTRSSLSLVPCSAMQVVLMAVRTDHADGDWP